MQPGRSRRSSPSALPRLFAQVCKQWRWREGAAANFRAARRGGARARGRRDRLTGGGEDSRGAEERAAERGQQAGARHAVGTRARERALRPCTPRGSHSCSWTGINQAAQHRPGPRAPPRPSGGGPGAGLRGRPGKGGDTEGSAPPPPAAATPGAPRGADGQGPSLESPRPGRAREELFGVSGFFLILDLRCLALTHNEKNAN